MKKTFKYKNLETLKRAHCMSSEDLMKLLNKHRATYYTWQQKGNIPSADVIKLHEIFNVSTDILLDVQPLNLVGQVKNEAS